MSEQSEVPTSDGVVDSDVGNVGDLEDVSWSLDDLLNDDLSDDPALGSEHQGLPHYSEILKHVPEDARKLIGNMRADYTRKTQEIAELRKSLSDQQAAIQRDRDSLVNGAFNERIQDILNDTTEYDIFDTEGQKAEIKRQAAALLQEMIAPIQQEQRIAQRQTELNNFKEAHPDLTSDGVRTEVAKLLIAKPHMRLEDAYWQVKGQQAHEIEVEKANVKTQRKEALKKIGTGRNVKGTSVPAFSKASDAFEYFKSNPSAMEQILKKK